MRYPIGSPLPAGAGVLLPPEPDEPAWAAAMTAEDWDYLDWAEAVAADEAPEVER